MNDIASLETDYPSLKKAGLGHDIVVIAADEVTIEPGIGKVDAKGSRKVEIDKNTTYVMKAKNVTGEITYNLEVEVVAASQP